MAAQIYVIKSPCFAIFAYFAVEKRATFINILIYFYAAPVPTTRLPPRAGRGQQMRWCIPMLVLISIAMVGIGFVRGAKLMMPFQSCDTFCIVAIFFSAA